MHVFEYISIPSTLCNNMHHPFFFSQTAEPDTPPFEVVQFHFLGWPDHGVPTNSTTLINFIKQVRKSHPFSSKDYLLVHCSAGVGRTGTFITLDCMLERIRAEKTINIFPFVKQLRTERVLMVQTLVSTCICTCVNVLRCIL